jgi:hypothetical protein
MITINIPTPLIVILIAALIIGFAIGCGRLLRESSRDLDRIDQLADQARRVRMNREQFIFFIPGLPDDEAPRLVRVNPPPPARADPPLRGKKWVSKDGIEVEW